MDLDDVEAFAAVVQYGGFRAAAQATFTSQSSLSRQVKHLEEDLGVPLLLRGPFGIKVTAHGAALVKGSSRLSDLIREIEAATVGGRDEVVRLGAAGPTAAQYLSDFIADWILTHPHKHLVLVEDGALRLEERLLEGQCDIAVLAAPVPRQLRHLPIRRAQVHAIVPPGHRLAETSGPLPIGSLHGERILTGGRASASTAMALAAAHVAGVSVDVVYESSVWQTLATLAEKGVGIAIVGDNLDTRGWDLNMRPLRDHDGRPVTFDLRVAWRPAAASPVALEVAEGLSRFSRPLRRAAGR
jgi:LysR family hydrogen peroxide-inducible transcriptional activator